jgi:hypothetical protein
MTVRADSLAGQIIAVLSRRAPAFQPRPGELVGLVGFLPALRVAGAREADGDVSPPGLDAATLHWRTADPQTRFRQRLFLLELTDVLSAARGLASASARDLALARGSDRAIASVLPRVGVSALDVARDLAHARDLALASAVDLDRVLSRALDFSRALAFDLDRVLAPRARDRARARARVLALSRALASDLAAACDNLAYAANSFTGADLSAVDLTDLDLGGLRWDDQTRWPSPEWAERMRRASVEHPPGSGTFVVLPEGQHSAEATLA